MGAGAPSARACRRTLERLAEDENDDVSRRMVSCAGRPRELSEVVDLYIGLLICEGHSQRSVAFIINGERAAEGLDPISRHQVEDAEKRVQLICRRRRSKKSGSSDLESAWCKASFAFAAQIQARLRRGAELAALRSVVGTTLKLIEPAEKMVACLLQDDWEIIGLHVQVRWASTTASWSASATTRVGTNLRRDLLPRGHRECDVWRGAC
eukprot:2548681-Prymnesium_polylepis.1